MLCCTVHVRADCIHRAACSIASRQRCWATSSRPRLSHKSWRYGAHIVAVGDATHSHPDEQICVLKAGMWFTRLPSVPVLDLVAFTGYKYFGLTINTVMGLLGGALLYYLVLLFTASAMAYFMHKTMQEAVQGGGMMATYVAGGYVACGGACWGSASMRVDTDDCLCGCSAAGLQVLVMWWLGYSGEL